MFRDIFVMVSDALCGCGDESSASGAPFSLSVPPLRGWSYASTQGRGARFSIIPLQHRSLRIGFEPRSGTRDEVYGRTILFGAILPEHEVALLCVQP
jgi:hypothetical protein